MLVSGETPDTAAAAVNCFPLASVPEDYSILLPPLPSGEAMRRAVVLHCDVGGRPYQIDDFRQPMKDLRVLQEVAGIGVYQMSHVWLLNMKTDEAKKKLLESSVLNVKNRPCLVIDLARQQLRLKLHWVAWDVSDQDVRRALSDYGDVMEVTRDRWKVPDFENAATTTRTIRLVLREGVTLEHLPHKLNLGSGAALVVVPGRAPMCFRCRDTGHVCRDCRVPRCAQCRAFGHEERDCSTRSETSVVNAMDEDEPAGAEGPAGVAMEQEMAEGTGDQEAKTAEPEPVPPVVAADTQELPVCPVSTPMDIEPEPPKRRLNDIPQEQRLRQLERQWKVVVGNKRLPYPPRLPPLPGHTPPH